MFDSRNGLWRRTGAIGRSRALRAIGRCLGHKFLHHSSRTKAREISLRN